MKTTTTSFDLPAFGSKNVRGRNIRDIAKDVRKDIAAAIKAGALPAGLKCSVTISRYSMGQSLNIRVTQCPVILYSPARVAFELKSPHSYCELSVYSEEGERILRVLKALHGAYNRDESDLMTDYFDVDFYGGAEFAHAVLDAQRDRIKTALALGAPVVDPCHVHGDCRDDERLVVAMRCAAASPRAAA